MKNSALQSTKKVKHISKHRVFKLLRIANDPLLKGIHGYIFHPILKNVG